MPVIPVKSLEQFKEIISADKYSVFDFWATWCGPCKMISPVFEELSAKYDHVEFYNVDVDDQDAIAQEVGIRAMPTFMMFKNGAVIETALGAVPANLDALLAKAVKAE